MKQLKQLTRITLQKNSKIVFNTLKYYKASMIRHDLPFY